MINESFIPYSSHIKKQPALFHRFTAIWTPTVLLFSSDAIERYRIEGYLPREEFEPALLLALARVSFVAKQWKEAEAQYQQVMDRYASSTSMPEAIYWRGVCRYKATEQHEPLMEMQNLLKDYPQSQWAIKASVW